VEVLVDLAKPAVVKWGQEQFGSVGFQLAGGWPLEIVADGQADLARRRVVDIVTGAWGIAGRFAERDQEALGAQTVELGAVEQECRKVPIGLADAVAFRDTQNREPAQLASQAQISAAVRLIDPVLPVPQAELGFGEDINIRIRRPVQRQVGVAPGLVV